MAIKNPKTENTIADVFLLFSVPAGLMGFVLTALLFTSPNKDLDTVRAVVSIALVLFFVGLIRWCYKQQMEPEKVKKLRNKQR